MLETYARRRELCVFICKEPLYIRMHCLVLECLGTTGPFSLGLDLVDIGCLLDFVTECNFVRSKRRLSY